MRGAGRRACARRGVSRVCGAGSRTLGMLSWIQILTLTSMLRHSCTSRFSTACTAWRDQLGMPAGFKHAPRSTRSADTSRSCLCVGGWGKGARDRTTKSSASNGAEFTC